ncbi:MAG: hypothetical protein R3305_03635 [Gammaproteobacteria bacterium]|nr:hypothetical protein [Gammaproteobacteria bacterium]
MNEIMYDHSSFLIVALLFVVLIGATELGYRFGFSFAGKTTEPTKGQINTIQGSLLGVLALLLGFTFSLSLQRFDTRSQAVIDEANAIGTAILRADLLPESVRAETAEGLRAYLDLRVEAGAIPLNRAEERAALVSESARIVAAVWRNAARAAEENPNPVTTGLFIQALNEMIDAYGTRDAALDRHVPEPVLFLMFAAFILTALLVGYASGVSGHRASFATYILVTLVTFLVLIVIDLDRPRRGIIEVSQQPLIDLQSSLEQL